MRHYSEKKILADKKGDGYIFQMFYNELQKHKRPIGIAEVDEVLTALGYTLEDLERIPALKAGLNMAVCALNDEVYEDNRPQPVDHKHFTGKDGQEIQGFTLAWYMTQAVKDALSDLQFKIDLNEAVTSYLLCEWGTLAREADEDNARAMKDPESARIVARYHTCKGDIYIKTKGPSETVISFTYELVKKYVKQLESSEAWKNSRHNGKTGNYSVYMHVSPDEKLYVGMTQDIEQRYGYNGNGYREQPDFHDAIKKYGWDNLDHAVIASDLSKEEAEEREHDAIVTLNAKENGYNRNDGGSGSDCKPVICITDGKTYSNAKETAEHYSMCEGYVRMACRGAVKSAKGMKFEYLKEVKACTTE